MMLRIDKVCILMFLVVLKGLSKVLFVLCVSGPEMTRLLPIKGFGPDGVVGTSSSLVHCSLLLTSLPLPSFVLLC